jgi:hypothetical protein
MYKTLFSFILLTTLLQADAGTDPAQTPAPADQTTPEPVDETAPEAMEPPPACVWYGSFLLTEFKMGYFRFGDKKLRHWYDKGILDLQLTSTYRLIRPFYLYGSLEYMGDNGRRHTGQKIKIRIVPISLGLQYLQKITPDFKYYLTLGPRYYFVHQWNHSHSQTHQGFGGFANTGFLYYLSENIVVDAFAEYSYKRMNFHNLGGNLQVGGLTFGGGIGYFW